MDTELQPLVGTFNPEETLLRFGDHTMDASERAVLAEKEALRLQGLIATHERVCSLRYAAIETSIARLCANVKWLAIAVGCLILVQVGVASVEDILRSGAGRIGVTVSSAPGDK